MTPAALVDRLAGLVTAVARPHPTRVGIDGPDCAGKTTLADALAGAVRPRGRTTIRVSADDFHQPRSIRHRDGQGPEEHYRDSFNVDALVREVLAPLGPGGSGRYLPTLWDLDADRATRAAYATAPPDAVLLLDGVFLQRPELVDHLDVRIYVDVSERTVLRRARERDADRFGGADAVERRYRERYLPAQAIYAELARPRETAHAVVRNNDAARPALEINALPAGSPGSGGAPRGAAAPAPTL